MPRVDAVVSTDVVDTFRVAQIAGMFDVPLSKKATQTFSADLPGFDESWEIGAIIGPSGSGKSTIARKAFGDAVCDPHPWPHDRSVLDGFPQGLSGQDIVSMLTSVGFSSPPDWIKPHAVLSNGQKFRADLARALLSGRELVVIDEFTSVVDRQVAQVCSAALAKTIRAGRGPKRFVAVSCHYDIVDWLQPDWVVDMQTGETIRRERRQRPPLELEVRRVPWAAWRTFAPHHYLTSNLNKAALCYGGFIGDRIVGFSAVMPMLGRRNYRRMSRLVVLPDWQGIGIGRALALEVARLFRDSGLRIGATAAHPSVVRSFSRDPAWKCIDVQANGHLPGGMRSTNEGQVVPYQSSVGRSVASFVFVEPG